MESYYRSLSHRKLHASGNWNNGSNCRSQSRNANNWQWNADSNISSQFLADTGSILAATLLAGFNDLVQYEKKNRIHDGDMKQLVNIIN